MASSDGRGGGDNVNNNRNWGLKRHSHLGFTYSGSNNSQESLTQKFKNVSFKSKPTEAEQGGGSNSADNSAGGGGGGLPLRPHAEDCSYYMRTGLCRFGSKCKYNHPLNRPILADDEEAGLSGSDENSDKSSVACKFYQSPRGCKNGESCKYLHSKPEPEMANSDLNFMGLPIREGEKECPFYMRYGSCAYGPDCRFHHPNPTYVEGSDSCSSTLNADAVGYYGSTAGYVSEEPFSQHLSGSPSILRSWPSCMIPNYGGLYMDSPTSYVSASSLYPAGFHQTTEWSGYQVTGYRQEEKPPRPISKGKAKMDKLDPSKKLEELQEDAARWICAQLPPPPPSPRRDDVELNELDLPLRPDKEVCFSFENYGVCRHGPACPFDHPMDKRSKNIPDFSKSGTMQVTIDEEEEVDIWKQM